MKLKYGKEVDYTSIERGDIVQLSFDGTKFEHSLVIIVDLRSINRGILIKY